MDIFGKLNELNLALQGKDKTVIDFIDVPSAFQSKLQLWKKMFLERTRMFPILNQALEDKEDTLVAKMRDLLRAHLKSLHD